MITVEKNNTVKAVRKFRPGDLVEGASGLILLVERILPFQCFSGMVIFNGTASYPRGYCSSGWAIENFHYFEGTIKLVQES